MACKTPRSALTAIIISLLLAGLPASIHAMGSKENPLAVADGLIKDKKYDEAVLLLTEYIKDNPERFDQAQARLRKIISIRNAYNKKATELLEALDKDPRNSEKHLALIAVLEQMDKNPNPDVRQFVEDTKLKRLFVVNRTKLEDIMAEAHALTDQGKFVEAARHYSTGFSLYRPEFESGSYDSVTVRSVFAHISDVEAQIGRMASSQAALNSAAAALRAAFSSGDPKAVDAALPAMENALTGLANIRAQTIAVGDALERQFALFQQADPTLSDSSFLPFAYRFILGRTTESRPEGVSGAMAAQWAASFDSAAKESDADLVRRFAAAERSFVSGDFAASGSEFRQVGELADRALRFQGMWSIFLPTDIEKDARAFGRGLVATRGSEYLRIQHLRDTAQTYVDLTALREELANQLAVETAATAGQESLMAASGEPQEARRKALAQGLSTYRDLRSQALRLIRMFEAQGTISDQRDEEVARLAKAGFDLKGASEIQTALGERIGQSIQTARDFEIQTVALSAKAETDILVTRLEEEVSRIAEGRSFVEGTTTPGAGAEAAPSFYPTRGLTIFSDADKSLKAVRKDAADVVARYQAEPQYISAAPSVVIQVERARALDAEAARRIDEAATLALAAKERQRQAQSNKLEADLRLKEARTALAREDFDSARERLERARERYLASLTFEDDPELRGRSDRDLESLGTQIVRAENDRVVRETRRLLTEGKSLYNTGEFARAEESLLQARARWKVTHTNEPEPEVEYWIRLVQTALSVKTGRDIPQTAPLYPEMSQLLSLARKYYEEGKDFMGARDKVSALKSFDLAKKKIQEVKVVFPLNQDARVLELRINQISDPGVFNQEFARLVSQAKAKIDSRQDLQTVYSDLLDLQAIDPKYPGLKSLIERLEILIGMRLPPPDPKALAEARNLTAAAQKTFDSREVSRFPTALAQLNRALELDPNNDSASRLKDRILTYVGGTATLVLPSAGEAIFNEAVTFFQNGDYLSARIRLTRLYDAYPQARRVQKASDLDARLTARGY
jgi:hypothetical protein